MTWILSLVFRTLTLTTGSQQLLDLHGWLYVQNLHYIPVHSYTKLGRYLLKDLRKVKPKSTTCKVSESVLYSWATTEALIWGDYYIQICAKEVWKYYLFTINC